MEAGRIFFSTSNVTINLLPALVAGALLLLLGLPLLALLFQPAAESTGSGYGAPAAEYGAPASTYGSPSYSRSVSWKSLGLHLLILEPVLMFKSIKNGELMKVNPSGSYRIKLMKNHIIHFPRVKIMSVINT